MLALNIPKLNRKLPKKECDHCFDKRDESESCIWPCPKVFDVPVSLHLVKCSKIHDPSKPHQVGLESLVIHKLKSKSDIELAFRCEKRYGTAIMTVKDFLELEYQIINNCTNTAIRDRLWIQREVVSLSDFCLIPKSFVPELETIREFQKRCKIQEIEF